jgi:hypothetical protein
VGGFQTLTENVALWQGNVTQKNANPRRRMNQERIVAYTQRGFIHGKRANGVRFWIDERLWNLFNVGYIPLAFSPWRDVPSIGNLKSN